MTDTGMMVAFQVIQVDFIPSTSVTFTAHFKAAISYHVDVICRVSRGGFVCSQTVLHNASWHVVKIMRDFFIELLLLLTTSKVLLGIH